MANFDFKSATPDTTFPSGGFMFGADSQGSATPSIYSDTAYRDYIVTLANTWSGVQTFGDGDLVLSGASSGSSTLKAAAVAGTTTLTLPGTTGTLAILGLAQSWTAQQTFAAGTITASTPTTFTQTWNSGGVTFNAMLVNVTDTASASASLIADWQVGGVSRFKIAKSGIITASSALEALNILNTGTVYYFSSGAHGDIRSLSAGVFRLGDNLGTGFNRLLWGGNTSSYPAWARDSAGMQIICGDGTTGTFISGIEQTAPSAPSANGYRIFAQDNGAGKTQLMVIFGSGAAQQIAIEP